MNPFTGPVSPGKAAIGGTVKDAQGQPVPWATVLITGDSPAHKDIAATTDNQGRYRFDSLTPGNYTLMVNVSSHPPQEGKVSAKAGSLARLDFSIA